MTAEAARQAFGDFSAPGLPAGSDQHKIERLLELRAVIDTLRSSQEDDLMKDLRLSLDQPQF
jgi:hypothetical protein